MSRFAKLFATNAIAVAGLSAAALAASASAAAEPAPPPAVPGIPALGIIQQFASNPASMGAVLQTAATALSGASSIIGGPAAATPIIGGPAASTVPVSPITAAPGTAPVTDPALTAPVGPGSNLVPLLNQFGVPANLANLTPSDMPFPIQIGDHLGIAPAAPAAPVAAPLTGTTTPPAGTVPLLPVAPGGVSGQMPLLNALP